jgi:hypothetical protein
VLGPLLVLGDREVVSSSSRATPSNIAIQGTKKDAKDDKKRQNQCPQLVAITAGYDDGDDKKADDSNKEYVAVAGRSVKHQARPPTNHFERFIK